MRAHWLLMGALCLAPAAGRSQGAPADANAKAAADGNTAPAPGVRHAPSARGVDYTSEDPPPTSYDQLGQEGQASMAPESFALVRQLGRVLVALLLTCTLIYLFFRLGLPRVMQLWLKQGDPSYFVRERVSLDTANALVRVEHESGVQYLLGVSSAGVKLIDKLPAPPGGPLSSPRRGKGSFAAELSPHDAKDAP